MNTPINPFWRQFWCRACGRLISECRPAGTPNTVLPTIDDIESCALCARENRIDLKAARKALKEPGRRAWTPKVLKS